MSHKGQTTLTTDLLERVDNDDHGSVGGLGGQTGPEWIFTE